MIGSPYYLSLPTPPRLTGTTPFSISLFTLEGCLVIRTSSRIILLMRLKSTVRTHPNNLRPPYDEFEPEVLRESSIMDASCQCGAVTFKTPLRHPLTLYICHCAECRRQTSSAFGASAIFPRFPLPSKALLSCYKYVISHTGCGSINDFVILTLCFGLKETKPQW